MKILWIRDIWKQANLKSDANYEDGAIVQGVDLGRYKQKTNSLILKADYTYQANRFNMIEAGLEGQYSDILFGPPGFFISYFVLQQMSKF